MSDEEDYNSEEDEDYVPVEGEIVSEEENSGDEEDLSLLVDGEVSPQKGSRKKKGSSKKKDGIAVRKRKGGIKLDEKQADGEQTENHEKDESEEEAKRRKELAEQIAKEEEAKKAEREKKRADDLWSSFMSDVKRPSAKPSGSGSGLGALSTQVKTAADSKVTSTAGKSDSDKAGKVTITKVFDFAGEEVKITKEVDANSKEAKAEEKKKQEEEKAQQNIPNTSNGASASVELGVKRPAVGGLGSVLSKINKKNKMGTLEKSKIDWDSFKKKEGIVEDLKIHNKGKQGYMERMAFLQRADQRQYEIERDIRLSSTSKR